MKTFRVLKLERPEGVPKHWPVYNAPRPLLVTVTWEGDWRRGRHFCAVDPHDERKAEMLRSIEDLDGWQAIEVDHDALMAWIKDQCKRYDYDGPLLGLMDGFQEQYIREGWGLEAEK